MLNSTCLTSKRLAKSTLWQKSTMLLLLIISVFKLNAQTYNVTFSVDMNTVTSGFTTPEINGTFNSWCGGCAPMSDSNADGIWELTIALAPGTYEYKFAADYWNIQENLIPGTAGTVTNSGYTNRQLIVGSSDITLTSVCWGFATPCASAPVAQNVTFQVDLANVSGFTTPTINGDFNGWSGTANPLTQVGTTSIWQTTIALLPGNYQYKFAYDNWSGQENLTPGTSCTYTDGPYTNRALVVGNSAQTIPVVCWGSCNNCAAPSYNTVFKVDMANVSGFGAPYVNGTFNGWCGSCTPMTQVGSTTVWQATIPLEAGTYEYKFTYDGWNGQENLTPGSSCSVTNNGYTNRYVTVASAQTLPVVCWESCLSCVAPVADVTFKVDMTNETGFTTPYVNGTFNGWCGDCNPMTDANGDGIWETTLPISAGTIEFKYTVDGWTGQESLASGTSCTQTTGSFTNRILTVGTTDITMPVTCYGSCSSCATPSGPYNVTFKVDMQYVTGFTTPYVNGTFNNWCGTCAPMTDANGDGIWELTASVPAGAQEYKFTFDGWNGQETLSAGSLCTVTNYGFTNRSLNVAANTVLPVACWSSCSSCTAPTPVVTFRLDMNNVSEPFTTPEVNGSFNNWCGGCAPMSDANGDNIWEISIPLPTGTYEYKYAYDSWTGQESLSPGTSCTVTNGGFTNRSLVVTSNTTLPVVCYSSCSACSSATWQTVQSGNWGALSTWNQGTLPPTGAEVIISSGHNVTINAASQITSITVQPSAALTLNADLKITNGGTLLGTLTVNADKDLTLSGGSLVTNGGLFLKSGANLMHGVGTPGAGGNIIGSIHYQQIGHSSYSYNFWSSPVNSSSTNLLGAQRYTYNPVLGTASTADDANEPGWVPATGSMVNGLGYASVYAGTVNFNGIANNGTIILPVAAPAAPASHFNLIGNPFPSALDANAFLATNGPSGTNTIGGAIYFWDDDNSVGTGYSISDYAVWNGAGSIGGGGNTPNGKIAPGQGFLVTANNSANIQFTNSMRSSATSHFFNASDVQRVRLSLSTDNGNYNETLIAFINDATEEIDGNYDALKMQGNPNIAFYSYAGSNQLAIQGLPELTQDRIIPLGVNSNASGNHQIKLAETENLPESVLIFLVDNATGTITNMRNQATYDFVPTSMNLNERFVIRFTAPVSPSVEAATCNEANGNVSITNPSGVNANYELVNASNIVLSQGVLAANGNTISSLAQGDYSLKLMFNDGYVCSLPVAVNGSTDAEIVLQSTPTYAAVNEPVSFTCTTNGNVRWMLNNTTIIGYGSNINYQFSNVGVYTISAVAQLGNCTSETSFALSVGITGIAEANTSQFTILPNPASTSVQVTFNANAKHETAYIQLLDITGKCIQAYTKTVDQGTSIVLPIEAVQSGLYFISVTSENYKSVSRLIIE